MSGRIFLLAGEPSGDAIGARLIQALRDQAPGGLELAGVGGPQMAGCGVSSLSPMPELSSPGAIGVPAPRLWRQLRRTVQEVERGRPDLVLTIDGPDFGLRLQRRLAGRPLVRVHYGASAAWTWTTRGASWA